MPHGRADERGSGLVGSFFGAVVFLAFLALAAHALISLYAASVITSNAWDSARRVADSPDDASIADASDATLRSSLDGFEDVETNWQTSNGSVGLTVSVKRPMLLPRALVDGAGFDRISRTVWVRSEQLQ